MFKQHSFLVLFTAAADLYFRPVVLCLFKPHPSHEAQSALIGQFSQAWTGTAR